MAVRPDDQIAGQHQSGFRQKGVFDARTADFKIMRHPHLPGKLTHDPGLGGGLDILIGNKVIGDQAHPLGIKQFFPARLIERRDGQRSGNVIGEYEIQIRLDQLSGVDDFPGRGVGGQDLFSDG